MTQPYEAEPGESSLKADLEAAWDQVHGDDDAGDGAPTDDAPPASEAAAGDPPQDEQAKEPASEDPAELSVEEALKQAFDEADPAKQAAAADGAWLKEQRRLADELIRANGVDPANRHEAGLSRRGMTRSLYAAAKGAREKPVEAIPNLFVNATRHLDPVTKLQVLQRTINGSGYEHASALVEAERQELEGYRSERQQAARDAEARQPDIDAQIAEFAPTAPHFERVKQTMGVLIGDAAKAGRLLSLEDAYDAAVRSHRLPDRAQAADQARRDKLARVKAASTPRTMSTNARAVVDHSDKSVEQLLRETWNELEAGA